MTPPFDASDSARDFRSRLQLPPGTLAGLVIAAVAVSLIALFTYRSLASREDAVERVTRTLEAQRQLEAILSDVKDAETGQRGFLLTGEERYLEPYTNAKASLAGEIIAFRSLIADNTSQQRRLDTLERLAAEKIDELGQTIAARRSGNPDGAISLLRTDRGKAAMDRIRALIAEMEPQSAACSRAVNWNGRTLSSSPLVSPGVAGLLLGLSSRGRRADVT